MLLNRMRDWKQLKTMIISIYLITPDPSAYSRKGIDAIQCVDPEFSSVAMMVLKSQ